ncbi:bacillithiol system redox-active protein YtxJ [Paenibacillus sp. FJAT-26967]|uniref:bacillithiol system redox-active protein YtxJ n=1 Tax=Paenibacillus sp. FJAT-26967 TaxID=1729690 RepID=UPI000839ACE6|nr:bacillithiol system redox-active protein YtxJ [Paenibacillus sp. FJAT-26967]
MANWTEITTVEEWNDILENSTDKPLVILKHSTTCPVSASALEEYDDYLGKQPNQEVGYYLVKVIESRPVSNKIAEDIGVKHASPQILYVKNKESYWNTSHWSVTAKHIAAVLD